MIKKYHVSLNLFNVNTITTGYLIRAGNTSESRPLGNIEANSLFSTSDYIPVNPNTTYTVQYTYFDSVTGAGIVFFSDNSGSTISGVPLNQQQQTYTFTTPNNCNYLRFSYRNTNGDNEMFEKGSTAHNYEPYGNTWNEVGYKKYETATDTFSTLPHEVIGDGQSNLTWSMKGNMQVNGTPTPQNPITPAETGDKTANLFDASAIGSIYPNPPSSTTRVGIVVKNLETNADYYLSINNPSQIQIFYARFDGDTRLDTSALSTTSNVLIPMTGANSVRFWVSEGDSWTNITNIMLSKGSTAQTYEPYGYKIPISFGQGTYTNYLSEPIRKIGTAVDSMASTGTANRVIKKWTLTGTENFEWKKSTAYSGGFYTSWHNSFGGIQNGQFYCSHAQYVSDITDYQQNTCYSDGSCNIRIMQSSSTVQDWIDYLSQQYAAGTPVTVWYVLETATTETFTAPSIPTSGSPQSFDVSTTLKPSEVSLTYHGWHEHEDTKFTT